MTHPPFPCAPPPYGDTPAFPRQSHQLSTKLSTGVRHADPA